MFKLALINIVRNRRRTMVSLFLVISGTFLIAFMRFLTYGFNQDMINNSISLDSGYLEMAAYGWNEKQTLGRAMQIKPQILYDLMNQKGVSHISKRLRSGALLNFRDKTRFISVLAADPEKEQKITTIHKTLISGNWLDQGQDISGAVIGFRLARAMKINLGDEFYLVTSQFDGSTGALKLRLKGIYNSRNTALDSSRVYITLNAGEKLFGTRLSDQIFYTSIAMKVDNYLSSEKIKKQMQNKYPDPKDQTRIKPEDSDNYSPVVLDWRDLNPGILELLNIATWKMNIFFIFIVISISFGVLNSVQMSIQERLRQIGIMLAIGTKARQLFLLISWEIIFLLLPGIILGILFAGLLAQYFHNDPIQLSGSLAEAYKNMGYLPRWRPIVNFGEVLTTFFGMFFPSYLVSLFSAGRIFKLNPVRIINLI